MYPQNRSPSANRRRIQRAATDREGNNLKDFKDFNLENGSSQGHNLALTVLRVPSPLDSGWVGPGSRDVTLRGGQNVFLIALNCTKSLQIPASTGTNQGN